MSCIDIVHVCVLPSDLLTCVIYLMQFASNACILCFFLLLLITDSQALLQESYASVSGPLKNLTSIIKRFCLSLN